VNIQILSNASCYLYAFLSPAHGPFTVLVAALFGVVFPNVWCGCDPCRDPNFIHDPDKISTLTLIALRAAGAAEAGAGGVPAGVPRWQPAVVPGHQPAPAGRAADRAPSLRQSRLGSKILIMNPTFHDH